MVATRILTITNSVTNIVTDNRLGMRLPNGTGWKFQNTGNSRIFAITTEETTYTVGTHSDAPFFDPGDIWFYDVADNEYLHLWTRENESSSVSIDFERNI